MPPSFRGIDHVHIYVKNWAEAEAWYSQVLGFKRMEKFMSWAQGGGPLTVESADGSVHLALFEEERRGAGAVAMGTGAKEFLEWKRHLEAQSLGLRVSDHQLAWSMYFQDPFGNDFEITTYEHEFVRAHIQTEPNEA